MADEENIHSMLHTAEINVWTQESTLFFYIILHLPCMANPILPVSIVSH